MLHGFAAGKAFYAKNFSAFAALYPAYSLDFLGTGLSHKPSWKAKSTPEAEVRFLFLCVLSLLDQSLLLCIC
jgi:pimeloyl-ACP methyl ester carboxylesterase